MSYLIQNDFKKLIQVGNLSQVINNDSTILESAMLDSEATAIEYLEPKYLIDNELQDTNPYDPAATYQPGNRVVLDGPAFDATQTYILGTIISNNGNVYICSLAVTVPAAFDISNWTLLGAQYNIYYIANPYPGFNVYCNYNIGDIVSWKGNKYTCVIASQYIDHTILIQLQYTSNIPLNNIFPDDPNNGIKYWGTPTPITIGPGVPPANLSWTLGDNRNRSLVRHMVAIVLYIVHQRIAPQNVPAHIARMYHGSEQDRIATKDGVIYADYSALGWFQAASRGYITVSIPSKQPRQGGRIRWGSKIRNQNGY